jgi:outer membrane protein assembly factor BamE (lipoprotein component of BamABCDE complex)
MRKIIVFVLAFSVVGCCFSVGRNIDQTAIAKIEKGKTTDEQVLSMIGSPDLLTRLADGEVTFFYHHVQPRSLQGAFIPVVIGDYFGGSYLQSQTLVITFGANRKVKDILSNYGETEKTVPH